MRVVAKISIDRVHANSTTPDVEEKLADSFTFLFRMYYMQHYEIAIATTEPYW